MRKARLTGSQIVAILKKHEAGAQVPGLARRHGPSENTIYRWRSGQGINGVRLD